MEEKNKMLKEELEKKTELVKEINKERENIYEGKEKIIQKKTSEYYEIISVKLTYLFNNQL